MDNPGFEHDFAHGSGKTTARNRGTLYEVNHNLHNLANKAQSDILARNAEPIAAVENESKVGLKRKVGLISAVAFIVGTMIGSGIFISPGGLLRETQSVGLSLLVWAVCGFISTLGAVTYIELGTVVPRSGGEYAYLLEAFGEIPAFLFAWVSTILLKPASVAILGLSFAKYSIGPFMQAEHQAASKDVPDNCPPLIIQPMTLVCAVVITFITAINSISVSLATKVQNVFTIAKLLALVIIIIGGMYNIIALGKTEHLRAGFAGSNWDYGAIATAFYSGLWAYDGWNNLNYITEEIIDPYRNLPLAIMIGLPLVTALYILVNISYLTIISPEEIMDTSNSVGILFGERMLGVLSLIMPVSVALSTFGAANGTQFTAGRLCYVASREGHLIHVLSFVDVKRNTPSPAMIFNAAVAILMAVLLDIEGLIDFFSFTAWIFYAGALGSLIRLRITKPNADRPFKIPLVIPAFVLLVAIYLVLAPIIENPKVEYAYASAFILFGFVLYIPFVYFGLVLPGMGILTTTTQKILQVIPPDGECN